MVPDGNNIAKDSLRNNRGNQRNNASHQAAQDNRLIVALPAVPEHEYQQIPDLQPSGRKPGIALKTVTIYRSRQTAVYRHPLRVVISIHLVGAFTLRHQCRQLLCLSRIAKQHAAILFVPVI